MMRAFRVRTDTRIAPFLEPPRELFVATRSIDEWQRRAVERTGLSLVDVPTLDEIPDADRPAVVFFDDVFFTEVTLRNFIAEAMGEKDDVALALPDGGTWSMLGPASDAPACEGGHRFDLFHLTKSARWSGRDALRAATRPCFVRALERSFPIRLPRVEGSKEEANATLTLRIAAHVRHWLHVLRLSHLAIGVLLAEEVRAHPWRFFVNRRLLGRRGVSLARASSFVHPSAEIHPTADLEGAIIGPDCRVRAHAHVHYSVLGREVSIGDHAVVMGCTLADRVQVLRASYLALCAAMPGGTLANYKVQLSLFGRDVFLTSSAWLLDAKLKGGSIRIEHEGKLIPIESAFLGSCLGHAVTLGAQVSLAPGRSVPNGATLVGPVEHVVSKVPSELPSEVLTISDGKLTPIS